MSEECLKLTSYFNERDRTAGGLLADELMSVFGDHRLPASVMLRGVEGFGRDHQLHTDRLLSSAEDLPAVCIAVDRRARIEAMLAVVQTVQRKGLITLERARLLTGPSAPEPPPGDSAKLTIYVGRGQRAGGRPAFVAACDLLSRRDITGATVLLGVDGTRHGRRARARFFARNPDVPAMIIAVGPSARIAAVVPELHDLLADPLMTLEQVHVCKYGGELLGPPPAPATVDAHGLVLSQKLMVYSSPAAKFQGTALHISLIRHLRDAQAAGATSVRAIWGFDGGHGAQGDRLLQLRRHVPVVTVVIDTPERIARSFEVIDEVTREHGLVTSEIVQPRLGFKRGA